MRIEKTREVRIVLKKATNPIDRHVGSRVRMQRMMLGMSQEKLGEAIGLTFQQVQKYEKGTNRISASRLQHIAHVLNVPVAFFFDGAPGRGPARDLRWSRACTATGLRHRLPRHIERARAHASIHADRGRDAKAQHHPPGGGDHRGPQPLTARSVNKQPRTNVLAPVPIRSPGPGPIRFARGSSWWQPRRAI